MIRLILFILLISTKLYASPEFAKFYFSIDTTMEPSVVIDGQPVQLNTLDQACRDYYVEYVLINSRISRRLYIACIDDKDNLDSFITALAPVNPEMFGSFKFDGIQLGRTKQIKTPAVYDEDGNETKPATYETVGTAYHKFEKAKYIELMPDIKSYDEDGNETSSTRPIVEKCLVNFAGWVNDQYSDIAVEAKIIK